MKFHVLALTVLLAAVPGARAQVKDLAELFPASTRVYVEINGIGEVAKQVGALVKGSCLEDPPKSLEKFAKLASNEFAFAELLEYGMLLSPEALAEISRFRGGAIAITEFPDKRDKNPEMVGVLQAGKSNLPAIFMRLIMSVPLAKKVAEVEGVRLYRSRVQVFEVMPVDGKQEDRETGPVMALLPEFVIVGSSIEAVGDVIRRLKGKTKGPSLASATDFEKTGDLRAQPGLFAYAGNGSDLIHFSRWTVDTLKQRAVVYPPVPKFEDKKELPRLEQNREVLQAKEKGATGVFQEVLELAKGFRGISLNLTLKDGSAQVQGNVVLDKALWQDFFSGRSIDFDHLRFTPNHSRLAMLAALPEGTGFWDKLGKSAPLLETELSLALGKDLLKIARAGLIDSGRNGPVLLVEATKAANAPDLAAILGKLLKKEKLTKGRLIALGADRKELATLLLGKGLGADKKLLEALKDHQQAQVLLTWSVGQTVLEAMREDARRPKNSPYSPASNAKKEVGLLQETAQKPPETKEPPMEPSKKILELAKRSAEVLEPLPPFVLSLSKKSDQLILQGRQYQMQTLVPRLIDVIVEWELTSPRIRFEYAMPPPPKAAPKEAK